MFYILFIYLAYQIIKLILYQILILGMILFLNTGSVFYAMYNRVLFYAYVTNVNNKQKVFWNNVKQNRYCIRRNVHFLTQLPKCKCSLALLVFYVCITYFRLKRNTYKTREHLNLTSQHCD